MCDYSLHVITSRPAKVGDKLISTRFPLTHLCEGQRATLRQLPARLLVTVDDEQRHHSLVE